MRYSFSLLVLSSLFASGAVMSAEWKAEPNVSMRLIHNDNIHMSSINEEASTGYTFAPGLSLIADEQNWNAQVEANLRATRYSNLDNADSDNGNLVWSNEYLTERQTWKLDASYDKNTTLDTSPETASAEAGIGEDQRIQKNVQITPTWSWMVSQVQLIELSYTFVNSQTDETASISAYEYDTNSVSLGYLHKLSQKDMLSIFVSMLEYKSKTSSFEYEQPSVYVQYKHELNESDDLTIMLGKWNLDAVFHNELISCDFFYDGQCVYNPVYGDINNENDGTIFDITYNLKDEVTEWVLDVNRQINPNQYGGTQQKDVLKINTHYIIDPRQSFNLQLNAYKTETIEGIASSVAQDRKQYRINPSYHWKIDRNWALGISYQFIRQKFTQSGLESESNALYINLNLRWPRLASTY